jgi:Flp pilus assembly protein TadD
MTDQTDRELERAEHQRSIGQLDGAIDTLKRVLTREPDNGDAHALLAICLLGKRRLHAARIEGDMALTLAPESVLSHWVGAELAIAGRKFDAAEGHVERLLSASPQSAEFHRLKARLLSLTGRDRQRLPVLEQALACDPNDPETLAELADHHRVSGNLDEAERCAREALGISAENASALIALGHVMLARGDIGQARELALSALQADPENVGGLSLLTAIKARTSLFLGLWWRYATWGARVGPTKNIIVLLVAYFIFRVLLIVTSEAGSDQASVAISVVWLAIVVYSFVGPTLFNRALKKELESVRLRRF